MSQRSAFERLVAQRPDPDALWPYRRALARPLEIEFDPRTAHAEPGEVTWDLGPELSRDGTYVKYAATYHSIHEGSFSVVLHLREGELLPGDEPEGRCELGAVLGSFEWYEYGADLVSLRDSGFRLSWAAAQWLHEAARGELLDAHHGDHKVHGAVTARAIRLALFTTPYAHHDHALMPRHLDGEIPPPVLYLYGSRGTGSDLQRAGERAVLARAIAELTTHPDPAIDRLLRDPSPYAHEVLRDLLLDRGAPVELLLIDHSSTPSLARLPLAGAEDDSLDDELEALWHRVLELDPLIDSDKPEIFDLAGPVFA